MNVGGFSDLAPSVCALLAQETDPGAGGGGGLFGGGPLGSFLIMIGLCIGIYYLLVVMPQNKQQKAREAMLGDVSKGDNVVTTSGILAKVHRVDEKEVVLQVDKDNNIKMRFRKSAIAEVLGGKDVSDKTPAEKEPAKS